MNKFQEKIQKSEKQKNIEININLIVKKPNYYFINEEVIIQQL